MTSIRCAISSALLALLAATAWSRCAGAAGPDSLPGSVTSGSASERIEPRGADPAHHYLGAIDVPAGEPLRIVLYGDNRPGYRMQTRTVEVREVRRLSWRRPGTWLGGLACGTLLLAESIVPTLDGPRDLVGHLTGRLSGGREDGVLGAVTRAGAPVVMNLGDLVTDGRRGRLWKDFVSKHAALRTSALYLAAPGNHERLWSETGRSNWNAAMGEPAAPLRYWFAIDVPAAEARFVFLDSNPLTDAKRMMPDSLEQALAEAELAWADSVLEAGPRRRFVLMHHPLVSAGHHVHDWNSPAAARRRDRLFSMCVRHRVTAVFAGHEHLHQRVYLRGADGGGFWHVTTGGAGSPLYQPSSTDWRRALESPLPAGLTLDRDSARMKSEYHYCVLSLPTSTRASDTLSLEAWRVHAGGGTSPLDALDIARPPRPP